jgi:hypothetical protein
MASYTSFVQLSDLIGTLEFRHISLPAIAVEARITLTTWNKPSLALKQFTQADTGFY